MVYNQIPQIPLPKTTPVLGPNSTLTVAKTPFLDNSDVPVDGLLRYWGIWNRNSGRKDRDCEHVASQSVSNPRNRSTNNVRVVLCVFEYVMIADDILLVSRQHRIDRIVVDSQALTQFHRPSLSGPRIPRSPFTA